MCDPQTCLLQCDPEDVARDAEGITRLLAGAVQCVGLLRVAIRLWHLRQPSIQLQDRAGLWQRRADIRPVWARLLWHILQCYLVSHVSAACARALPPSEKIRFPEACDAVMPMGLHDRVPPSSVQATKFGVPSYACVKAFNNAAQHLIWW